MASFPQQHIGLQSMHPHCPSSAGQEIHLEMNGRHFVLLHDASVRSKSVKANFWKIVTHPNFVETAEELCLQLFGWYAFFVPIQQHASLEVQQVAYEMKNTKKNFKALFTCSPAKAVKMYQAEQLHRGGGRLPKPPSGCSAFMSLELGGHLLTDFA
ncbi:hypothetical protein CVT25_013035 [Psilocybe cyanescens]|uniref:Uncharacterized protein n=1 Tax=Psilocybe cyanescens TaxID=93625 RepID=A0A409X0W2_PSICY|nr:hypothetical protein CVT25_013035 [Psilocybe cyanescens]